MKAAQGFTLIELMIVVAIIAILAVIAFPAYQGFLARAQVSEGLSLAHGAKINIAASYADRAIFPTDNIAAGLSSPASISGRYVESVTVGNGNGQISVLFSSGANTNIAGRILILQAIAHEGSLEWQCSSPVLEGRYLPSTCR